MKDGTEWIRSFTACLFMFVFCCFLLFRFVFRLPFVHISFVSEKCKIAVSCINWWLRCAIAACQLVHCPMRQPPKNYMLRMYLQCKFLNVVIIFRSVHVSFVSIMLHIEYWSLHWANFGRFFGAVSVPKKKANNKRQLVSFPFSMTFGFFGYVPCYFIMYIFTECIFDSNRPNRN